jgi:hypothetical protein
VAFGGSGRGVVGGGADGTCLSMRRGLLSQGKRKYLGEGKETLT